MLWNFDNMFITDKLLVICEYVHRKKVSDSGKFKVNIIKVKANRIEVKIDVNEVKI